MQNDPDRLKLKGRGATRNSASLRFESKSVEVDGDWRDHKQLIDGDDLPFRTSVIEEHPKSILTFNSSPDLMFDRSVNAYRGCEHGCIYCYARPTHAYHDLSPGLDFETKLFAKPNAVEILEKTLAKPNYSVEPIAIGTNTDPYQPIEKTYGITRQIASLLLECQHPLAVTTKSDRVLRDMNLFEEMAKKGLIIIALSVTTLDLALARTLEPRASSPTKRLLAVKKLAERGIPVHVSIAPVIPAITDHEIEALVEQAALNGARSVSFIPMRLPHEVAPLFQDWLEVHFPDRAQKVMARVASIRGGQINDGNFHSRMKGEGHWAKLISDRLKMAAKRSGLATTKLKLRTDLFRPPAGNQLNLF